MPGSVTLVLGGARSGKSRLGESLAGASGLAKYFIATAQAGDDEMAERIARHQADRGSEWTNIEEPLALPEGIQHHSSPDHVVLVDCLTLWISNLMHHERSIEDSIDSLVAELSAATGPVILISNEVGLGIVPDNAMARTFRDHAGRCHQRVSAVAENVIFCVSGMPMVIKKDGHLANPEYAF